MSATTSPVLPVLPTLDEIRAAAELVYRFMSPTPQYRWPLLCERLGAHVWVKHENYTPTGSFKARTAIVYTDELMKSGQAPRGLISATRGNHGQSVALAAARFGIPATIVVPHGNSQEKNAAMRAQGAQLIEFGHDYQASREHAGKLAAELGYHFVPPYHRNIVKGVATYWLELFNTVPDLDVVYVSIGMGSGTCSAAAVRNALGRNTKIVGVVSEEAPAYAISFEQKKVVEAPARARLADGLACRVPDADAVRVMVENVDHMVRVSEEEIAEAMRIFFSDTHSIVEGAGAAALAGALKEKESLHGRKIGVAATGANIDTSLYAQVLAGTLQ